MKYLNGSGSGPKFKGTDPSYRKQIREAADSPQPVEALYEVFVAWYGKVIDLKALGAITDLRYVRKGVLEVEVLKAVQRLVRTLEKKDNRIALAESKRKIRAKRSAPKEKTPMFSAKEIDEMFAP